MRRPLLVLALAVSLLAVPSPRSASAGPLERRAAELIGGLATRRLQAVRFENAPLEDVLRYLRVATGWNFVVKRAVIQKANVDLDTVRTTLDLDDVTVGLVLELVLGPHDLVAKVEGNIVFVTTKADAMGRPVFVLHPISQLTWTKTNFRAPDIDLHPSDYHPPEEAPEEEIDESDPFRDPQHVVDLVKEMVDAPWDTEGWSLTANRQWLMVKAPRSVQVQVAYAVAQMSALK